MRVAVTGVTGFVGGAVAAALEDDGHTVTGFGRRRIAEPPCTDYRLWDITEEPPEDRPLVDAVVHCAALADDWATREEALRVNRDGTRRVRAAFPYARIVQLSTSSVYDAYRPSIRLSESAPPPRRYLSTYSESKALAERELEGSNAIILRPHAVYGPGDTTLLPRVIDAVREGRLILPAGAKVRHSLTHIDNLVAAVRASLSPASPRGVYNIADADAVLLSDVIAAFLMRRGVDARIVNVPTRIALAIAAVAEKSARVRGTRPRLTRYAVSQVGVERTFDISAAREKLGYEPFATALDGAEGW